MISSASPRLNQKGFSLIEIIVVLVVAALFGTMLFDYMGTSLTKSAEPVVNLQKAYAAGQIMENITADYRYLLLTDETPLTTLHNYITNGNVEENTPYYGDYTYNEDESGYILFNEDGAEIADEEGENRILKVTITSSDQTLTALFTK